MAKAILERLRLLGFGSPAPSKYWLTRFIFLRFLGGMYFIAFLILVNQGLPLIGENGLLPAKNLIDILGPRYETIFAAFLKIPDSVLVSSVRQDAGYMRLGRNHTILCGFNWVCQCSNTSYPLVSLHVLPSHRSDLVRIRLGDSTA